MSKRLGVFACALSALVSAGFAIATAGATPLSTARAATASSKEIAIPFKPGRVSFVKITLTLTQTSTGPTSGVPFTLSVANHAKLSRKIRVAAIGGMTGLSPVPPPPGSSGPPGTKSTYEILVAIDATKVRGRGRARVAADSSEMQMLIVFQPFIDALEHYYQGPVHCRDFSSEERTFAGLTVEQQKNLTPSELKHLAKTCP